MSAWGDRGASRSDREVSTADGVCEESAMTVQSSAKSVTITDKEIFLSQLTHEILHLTEQQKTPHQTQALNRCGHKNVPRHKNEPRNTQWWEVSVSNLLKSQGEELSFNTELKKKKCYCPKHVKYKVTCSLEMMLHLQREVHQEKRESR